MKTLEQIVELPKKPAPCPFCSYKKSMTLRYTQSGEMCTSCLCCDAEVYGGDTVKTWNSYLYNSLEYLLGWIEEQGYLPSLRHAGYEKTYWIECISIYSEPPDITIDKPSMTALEAAQEAIIEIGNRKEKG